MCHNMLGHVYESLVQSFRGFMPNGPCFVENQRFFDDHLISIYHRLAISKQGLQTTTLVKIIWNISAICDIIQLVLSTPVYRFEWL